VLEALEAFWRADWEALEPAYSGEAILIESPAHPDPIRGRDEVIDLYMICHRHHTLEGTYLNVVSSGHTVVVEWRIRGTITRPFPGQIEEVVGRSFDVPEVNLFKLKDGKILSNTIYVDGGAVRRQLGLDESDPD
jgi:steroid delta-isomerase-like uncharacterized protein